MEPNSLVLKMYADAAFAINDDLKSQQGFIIILCDEAGKVAVLDYSSKKLKEFFLVSSLLAAEVYAFVDGFDSAFVIPKKLGKYVWQEEFQFIALQILNSYLAR